MGSGHRVDPCFHKGFGTQSEGSGCQNILWNIRRHLWARHPPCHVIQHLFLQLQLFLAHIHNYPPTLSIAGAFNLNYGTMLTVSLIYGPGPCVWVRRTQPEGPLVRPEVPLRGTTVCLENFIWLQMLCSNVQNVNTVYLMLLKRKLGPLTSKFNHSDLSVRGLFLS